MNAATMERVIKIYARTLAELEKEVRLLQKEHKAHKDQQKAQEEKLANLQARLRKLTH